ncbi:hypothetical protein DFH09DRAFT_1074494 [Mycena vulgaris]|nr:hypothetical protein DFH09DRAFT_1074494 [Mycena vulgaris]
MEVINDIRSNNAARDLPLWSRADPTTVLAEELYSSESHFVLELVQNADDNTYGSNVTPTLNITLDLGANNLVVTCNENGFKEDQVRAICKIGASTKKHQTGYIGEKGIGFKSVFKVADKVFISSDPYKFSFDKHAELGMITPSWEEDCPGRRNWTQFTLQLSDTIDKKELESYLSDIDPTLLLFLRKLRSLHIDLGTVRFAVVREDLESNVIQLSHGITTPDQYLLVKQLSVHAFLPIRKYGFSFLIQGDFLTSANREDILSDSSWNITIRDALVSVFITALAEFWRRPQLALVWYRYIPIRIAEGFFSPFKDSLLAKLKSMDLLRSADGQLRRPSQLFVVSSDYLDDYGAALIAEEYLGYNNYYLSSEYDCSDGYSGILYALGIRVLSDSEFINALSRMNTAIRQQSAAWHESVSAQLLKLRGRHNWSIMALCMVHLQDGTWVAPNSGDLFFSSEVVDIPRDLGLRLLAKLDVRSSRFSLFYALGVRTADPTAISEKILDLHRRSWPSAAHALTHAHFLFVYRNQTALHNVHWLYLLNKDGGLIKATDLYMDDEDPKIMPISEIIPSRSRLLHEKYLTPPPFNSRAEWHAWLKDVLRVNVSPRVLNRQFSPEFLEFCRSGNTHILRALKDYWPRLKPAVNLTAVKALSNEISVICHDGTFHNLSATALCRGPLRTFSHLQFLHVEDPEDASWNFLGEFGVTLRPDGLLYLKWLRKLSSDNSHDLEAVISIYEQLQARFDEDASAIRTAFDEDRLILVAQLELSSEPKARWLSKSDVVWGGPPSMRSKPDLKRSYPQLHKFFRTQLQIQDCPSDILSQELAGLAGSGSAISNEDHTRVCHILDDISSIVAQSNRDRKAIPPWISKLAAQPIFPVRRAGTEDLQLRKLDDRFYVPDKSGRRLEMFGSRVDMLELVDTVPLYRIRPLLQTDHFRHIIESRYLDVAVTCKPSSSGERIHAIEIQEEYLMRAHLSNADLVKKFQNLVTFRAESVFTTYTIENLDHLQKEDLIIEEDPDRLVVLITASCKPTEHGLLFAEKLAVMWGLDRGSLSMAMCTPVELASMFLDKTIGQHGNSTRDTDDSWVLNMAPETTESGWITTRPKAVKGSLPKVPDLVEPAASTAGLEALTTRNLIELNMGMISNAASRQSLSPIQSLTSDFFAMSLGGRNMKSTAATDDEAHSSSFNAVVRNGSLPGSFIEVLNEEGPSHRSNAISNSLSGAVTHTRATPAEYMNGVLGEYFIFEFLRQQLPHFTEDNWTSELRGDVPGFSPYHFSSVADFRYPDADGILTRAIFGNDISEAWAGRWPEYHIEVKTTSGNEETPFHMSSRQLQLVCTRTCYIATELTLPGQDEIPAVVYVLVRVWNIRSSSPSFTWCPDPHRCLFTGRLRIASDVEVVLRHA